jgi:hypothetical protein
MAARRCIQQHVAAMTCGGGGSRQWRRTTASTVNGGGSRRGWQSTVVAVGGGGVNGGSERGGRIIIWSAFWGSGEQCSTCFYVVLCTIWY